MKNFQENCIEELARVNAFFLTNKKPMTAEDVRITVKNLEGYLEEELEKQYEKQAQRLFEIEKIRLQEALKQQADKYNQNLDKAIDNFKHYL